MKKKLLEIHYIIVGYYRESEEKFQTVELDVSVEKLLSFVEANENDSMLYDGYILNERQLKEVLDCNSVKKDDFIIDFEKLFYVLEVVGVYG